MDDDAEILKKLFDEFVAGFDRMEVSIFLFYKTALIFNIIKRRDLKTISRVLYIIETYKFEEHQSCALIG